MMSEIPTDPEDSSPGPGTPLPVLSLKYLYDTLSLSTGDDFSDFSDNPQQSFPDASDDKQPTPDDPRHLNPRSRRSDD